MSYNPYNQGPAAESGHGYGQAEQHEMQPYGQQSYGSPQQHYGSPQPQHSQYSTPNPYGSPNPQPSQYATPNPQQSTYGSPHPQQSQYGSPQPQQSQYGSPQPQQGGAGGNVLSQTEFLQRVSAIRQDIDSLETSIRNIATLHQQTLASSDNAARGQLDDLVAATQLKNTAIRSQLQSLKADAERTQDGSFNLKKRQFESLNDDFKKKIQGFLEDEKTYKERYREQLARQYRIVNPDATEDEVQQATSENADASEGIFAQALRTNRVGQASAVLGNVRARHNDMLKIEQSILQLLDLLNILNEQIVMQGAVIQQIDDEAGKTTDHLRDANVQIEKGVEHARRARKLKWWCLLVVVLICAIIALVLGIYFGVVNKKNN